MVEPDLPKLYLATQNSGKIAELETVVGERFDVQPRPQGVAPTVEDRTDLHGNAEKKAQEVSQAVDGFALADDSGLFVEALDGRPGVHSARFAELYWPEGFDAKGDIDRQNNDYLLQQLAGIENRNASFRCVLALASPNEATMFFEGSIEGTICHEAVGSSGFGYDPLFVPDGFDNTFAELEASCKREISHRAAALNKLSQAVKLFTRMA